MQNQFILWINNNMYHIGISLMILGVIGMVYVIYSFFSNKKKHHKPMH
jgi:uncharacterized membrane protein YukC